MSGFVFLLSGMRRVKATQQFTPAYGGTNLSWLGVCKRPLVTVCWWGSQPTRMDILGIAGPRADTDRDHWFLMLLKAGVVTFLSRIAGQLSREKQLDLGPHRNELKRLRSI